MEDVFEGGGEVSVNVRVEAVERVEGDKSGVGEVGGHVVEKGRERGVDIAEYNAFWEVTGAECGEGRNGG